MPIKALTKEEMLAQPKQATKRTVYRVNIDKFCKHVARITNGGIRLDHPSAVEVARECCYAQRGNEKREITIEEAARLVNKGFN